MKNQPPQSSKKGSRQRTSQKPWSEMNRKQRREMQRKIQSQDLNLEVVHPDAAGIDIGNEVHYVAYHRTEAAKPYVASDAPPPNCEPWPIGSNNAGSRRWPCNQQEFTGSHERGTIILCGTRNHHERDGGGVP